MVVKHKKRLHKKLNYNKTKIKHTFNQNFPVAISFIQQLLQLIRRTMLNVVKKKAPLLVTGGTPQRLFTTSEHCGALFDLPEDGWWTSEGQGDG